MGQDHLPYLQFRDVSALKVLSELPSASTITSSFAKCTNPAWTYLPAFTPTQSPCETSREPQPRQLHTGPMDVLSPSPSLCAIVCAHSDWQRTWWRSAFYDLRLLVSESESEWAKNCSGFLRAGWATLGHPSHANGAQHCASGSAVFTVSSCRRSPAACKFVACLGARSRCTRNSSIQVVLRLW